MKKDNNYFYIILISAFLFIPFLGSVNLFDWDEINFAEAAREMIETGDYAKVRIDFEPFHEKPPLFIWTQVISMRLFGVNEFAARFPNAMIGIFTLAFLYHIGKKIKNKKFALIWVLAYGGSFLPHFYFRSGIIDPLFNLFIFMSLYNIYRFYYYENISISIKYKFIKNAALLSALAVLTKGPVGFGLIFITWVIFVIINKKRTNLIVYIGFIFSSLTPLIIWFMISQDAEGNIFLEFINYQIRLLTTGDAGHGQPFYYHFVVLFIGVFPATAFIFQSFKSRTNQDNENFRILMIILLSVVLIIFSIVKTKIVHYSSMAYFPITYLAAYSIHNILQNRINLKRYTKYIFLIIGITFSILLIGFPLLLMNIEQFLPQIKDEFTKAILSANVVWGGYEFIIGIFYLFSIILSFIYLNRNNISRSILITFASTAIVIFSILPILAPKIESYTQRAPIQFYKSLRGDDVYLYVLGFKSYAQYFYSDKKIENSKYSKGMNNTEFREWLLNGNIDKPAYFVTYNKRIKRYEEYNLIEIGRKNGYVFLKRMPD